MDVMNVVDEKMKLIIWCCIDLDSNDVIKYNEFLSCAFNREKIMSKDNLELILKLLIMEVEKFWINDYFYIKR